MAKKLIKKKYVKQLRKLSENPALRYLAIGFAGAAGIQILKKVSERYPEIARFLEENLDLVEAKVADFRKRGAPEELHH